MSFWIICKHIFTETFRLDLLLYFSTVVQLFYLLTVFCLWSMLIHCIVNICFYPLPFWDTGSPSCELVISPVERYGWLSVGINIEFVGTPTRKSSSKSPLMTAECTMKTQESTSWGKETLLVPFALIYSDFTNSIFIPIQRSIKLTSHTNS